MEIDRIVPDLDQPRKEFDPDAIDRLAASLLKHGQLMPIRVRWNGKVGKWVVISGERRYRAAHQAGLKTICCLFNDGEPTPSEIFQEQLIENCLREDLKPIEQARAYRQLMEMHGWTAKQLSESCTSARAR
jgi:ParB family chromosome partitioning protein